MLFGPVFHAELLMTARRRRYYFVRFVYGLFLLLALRQQYAAWNEPYQHTYLRNVFGFDPTNSIKAMALFAEAAFVGFAQAQGIAILCLLPAFLGGVIADEHQRKTLHYLLASRLSSFEIVLGKVAARLLHVGVLIVMGVPIVCLVALFGGLDPLEVAFVYAGTLSMTLFAAGLATLVSVASKRPRTGIITAYILFAAWLFLPPVLNSIATYIEFSGLSWLIPVGKFMLLVNPQHCWEIVSQVQATNQINASVPFGWRRGLGGLSNPVIVQFLIMVALQTFLGLLFLTTAVLVLRPLRGGAGRWERRRTVSLPNLRKIRFFPHPACGENAMLWKEKYSAGSGGLGWLSSLPVALVCGLVLGAYLIESSPRAFHEFMSAAGGNTLATDQSRLWLNGTIRQCNVFLYMLLLMSVASAAAVSVTSEREQDTWISLSASLLSGREIILSKIQGAVWSVRRIVWLMLGVWVVGLASGAVHPVGVLLAASEAAAVAWFAAALGVYISLRAKNSTRALGMTFLVLLILSGGYLVLFIPWLNWYPVFWSGSSPMVEATALLSYRDVARIGLDSARFDPYGNPVVQSSAIIATAAVSIVMYSAGAFLLTALSLAAYSKAVDRPRRDLKDSQGGRRPHGTNRLTSAPFAAEGASSASVGSS